MLNWFKRFYYNLWWKYYYWKHPERLHLARSEFWQKEIKKLLLEDLNAMKFQRIID